MSSGSGSQIDVLLVINITRVAELRRNRTDELRRFAESNKEGIHDFVSERGEMPAKLRPIQDIFQLFKTRFGDKEVDVPKLGKTKAGSRRTFVSRRGDHQYIAIEDDSGLFLRRH